MQRKNDVFEAIHFTCLELTFLTYMLIFTSMKARKITQKELVELVAPGKPGVPYHPTTGHKWDVAILVPDCSGGKNRFTRSVSSHVDDASKKKSFISSIHHLFEATQVDDYQAVFKGSAVDCKSAKTISFNGSTYKLWELKPNKKDRIYFYADSDVKPPHKKTIFLLMAFHKKDDATPDAVTVPCTDDIKSLVREKGNIDFCEDKNVAKK